MRVSSIATSDEGYDKLLQNLFTSYDATNDILRFDYKDEMPIIPLTTLEDKRTFIRYLCEFAIEEEDIQIIHCRYGLDDGRALTFKQIGEQFDVSDEAVRSRLRKAQQKLRHRLNVSRAVDRWFRGI